VLTLVGTGGWLLKGPGDDQLATASLLAGG
jgi:hypothetical protein